MVFVGCRRTIRRGLPWALAVLVTSCLLLWSKNDDPVTAAALLADPAEDGDWVSLRLKSDQQEFVDHRGLHVVVGHYLGDANNVVISANLTDELLNRNMFDPKPKEGRDGTAVIIPSYMSSQMQKLYRINRFNVMASDRIPLNRSLPDVRKKSCKLKKIDINKLPSSSVIIVFHNEAWSTLLRTVHSVIDRSPKSMLNEIILVDDASTRKFLANKLDDYVAKLSVPTRIIRSPKRIGLIKARLAGARQAKGKILVFLDAHCECTVGWLVGLVSRVAEDRKRVVCPVIDIISDETFAYVRSFEMHWGAFNWDLHFRWYTRAAPYERRRDVTEAFRTPAMAGGLFAMDKQYFFELGGYDEKMEVWGGENLELSFRVWQCGGSVEIAPCSHVGHVFRKSSPYTFPGGVSRVLYTNLARVALVWMDEWKEFYFKFNPEAEKVRDEQQIRTRLELRDRLKCKGFKWYLDNVWPEHFMPTDKRFFGKIKNTLSNRCLEKPTGRGSLNQPMGPVQISACDARHGRSSLSLMFVMAPDEGLTSAVWSGSLMTDESVCLDTPEPEAADDDLALKVRIVACTGQKHQRWKYDTRTMNLVHIHTDLCLDLPVGESSVVLKGCADHASQKWTFEQIPWK